MGSTGGPSHDSKPYREAKLETVHEQVHFALNAHLQKAEA